MKFSTKLKKRFRSLRHRALISFHFLYTSYSRFQWSCHPRRQSVAARLLALRVCIPLGAWTFVSCMRCLLSVNDLCDGTIARPEKSDRLWCVIVCDLGPSRMRWPWPVLGCSILNEFSTDRGFYRHNTRVS